MTSPRHRKHRLFFVPHLMVLVLVFFLSSCSILKKNSGEETSQETTDTVDTTVPGPSELIIGTWKINDVKFDTDFSEELQAFQDSLVDEMKGNTILTITSDGSYLHTFSLFGQAVVYEGEWKLNEKGTRFETTDEDNSLNEKIKILELSEQSLILEMDHEKLPLTLTYARQDTLK